MMSCLIRMDVMISLESEINNREERFSLCQMKKIVSYELVKFDQLFK